MAMFDFQKLQQGLEAQNERREARQVTELATAARERNIANRSAKLAKDYDKSLDPLRQSIQTNQDKGNKARALADSNNPIDTLRLMGLQFSQPQFYTRKGRQARLAEDMQRAAALSHAYGVSQGALDRELLAAQAGLQEAEIIEQIGLERLKSIQEDAAIARDNLSAHLTLQATALHGLDEKQLSAAIQEADNNGGATNINGLDVESQTLKDRLDAVQQRNHERFTRSVLRQLERDEFSPEAVEHTIRKRAYNRALEQDQLANQDHAIAMQQYERTLQRDQVANVDHELNMRGMERTLEKDEFADLEALRLVKQGQRNAAVDEVVRMSQQKELQTYDLQEILTLRSNGYVSDTGEKFNPADVDDMYVRKTQAQSDFISNTLTRNALNNFDTDVLQSEKNRVDALRGKLPENSPLGQAIRNYEAMLGVASLNAGSEDFSKRMVAFATYQQARESFDKTVEAQAKAEAKGDKNLEQMKLAFYTNQPIPQDALFNAVQDRLDKGRSLADLFPPEVEVQLKATYREIYQQKLNLNQTSLTGAEDRKLLKQEAISEALNQVAIDQTQGRSEEIISRQVLHPRHPLHGRMSPQQMSSAVRGADSRAYQEWMDAHGLSEDEALAIRSGAALPPNSAINADQITGLLEDLRIRENDQLMIELEGVELGVGTKIADWWQRHGSEYINFEQSQINKNVSSFQEQAFRTVAGQLENRVMNDYSIGFVESSSAIKERHARRYADFVSYGSNPEYMQVAILDSAEHLTPEEKGRVWSEVIAPMLTEAKSMGLDFNQTNQFIERNLMDYDPPSKELGRIMKTMNRDRSQIMQKMGNWAWWSKTLLGLTPEPTPVTEQTGWYFNWKRDQRIAGGE